MPYRPAGQRRNPSGRRRVDPGRRRHGAHHRQARLRPPLSQHQDQNGGAQGRHTRARPGGGGAGPGVLPGLQRAPQASGGRGAPGKRGGGGREKGRGHAGGSQRTVRRRER